jgi:hypothetical protein
MTVDLAPTENARSWLNWIAYKTTPQQLDRMVDRVAVQTEASLKEHTPKRWFGQVRAGWNTAKPDLGVRVLNNDVRASNGALIILFLEEGTANGGTGMIRPRIKNRLYIPLTRRAAGGWHPGLVYGKDYILKKEVHGIKPLHIVADERPRADQRMREGMDQIVEEIVTREGLSRG